MLAFARAFRRQVRPGLYLAALGRGLHHRGWLQRRRLHGLPKLRGLSRPRCSTRPRSKPRIPWPRRMTRCWRASSTKACSTLASTVYEEKAGKSPRASPHQRHPQEPSGENCGTKTTRNSWKQLCPKLFERFWDSRRPPVLGRSGADQPCGDARCGGAARHPYTPRMFTTRPEIRGTFGVVASTHWLASASGMAVLEKGGNAFDAAVAAGFVLQVVEPHLNGPGGEVPIILLRPSKVGKPEVICGQGVAPAGATIAHYRDRGPGAGARHWPAGHGGARAPSTPGCACCATTARIKPREVLEYAIGYAERRLSPGPR